MSASPQSGAGAEVAEHFPRASVRVRAANPNHHLWNNNGTWYLHYTVHPTPLTKSRVRISLGTKSLDAARRRRDEILGEKLGNACSGIPAHELPL